MKLSKGLCLIGNHKWVETWKPTGKIGERFYFFKCERCQKTGDSITQYENDGEKN
jgi:hypothetical protein